MSEIIETGRNGRYYQHPVANALRRAWYIIGGISTLGWIAYAGVKIGEHWN